MKKLFQKFKNHKYRNLICVFGFVLFCFVLPKQVFAQTFLTGTVLKGIIDGILFEIGQLFGYLVTFFIGFLMRVAAYNEFTTSKAVELGWVLMRDVCNMFFIVILMIIAISTIIRVEAYNYKKMLPKLLIKAVLINFSLLFCGLLIDVSQVVTLAFVGAFEDAGVGNFITGLGLSKVYAISRSGNPAVGTTSTLLYGIFFLVIATVVIAAITFSFLGRIIAFWILIVLSPFTFLASASGFGAKYSDQWWREFTKYLIVGPVLAFFLWLSLAIMRQASLGAITGTMSSGLPSVGISEAGTPDNFVAFCISIAMLLGAYVASQQIGTVGSGAAKKVMGTAQKTGMSWVNWGGRRLDDTAGKFGAKVVGGAFGLSGYAFDSDRYKNKIAKGAAKTANILFTGGLGKDASKAGMKVWKQGGMQLRTIPKAWEEAEQRHEMLQTVEGRGTARGAFDMYKTGDETGQEYRAQNLLNNEEFKNLEERNLLQNTEGLVHEAVHGKKAATRMAAIRALTKNNDLNEVIKSEEFLGTLSPDDFKRMGVTKNKKTGKWEGVDASSSYARLHMLKKLVGNDVSEDVSAQFIDDIGEMSLERGNYQNWGVTNYDYKEGKFKFRDFWDENGNLNDGSEGREDVVGKHANDVLGKIKTWDSRDAARKAHHNTIKKELVDFDPETGKVSNKRTSMESHAVGAKVGGMILGQVSRQEFDKAAKTNFVNAFLPSRSDEDFIDPEVITEDKINKFREHNIEQEGIPEDIMDIIVSKNVKAVNAARKRVNDERTRKRKTDPENTPPNVDPLVLSEIDGINSVTGDPIRRDGKNKTSTVAESATTSDATPSDAAPTPPPRRERSIMADVDKKKYGMTQEKIKEYQDNDLDFYISDDYKKNQEKYYDQGAIERIDRSKSNLEEDKAKRILIDPKTNMNRVDVMSGIGSAKAKGLKGESAALAINAQNDKLKGLMTEGAAGIHLVGEDKDEAIEQLGAFYADQLRAQNEQLGDAERLNDEQMQAEVDGLKSSLGQASSLRLINKNREGYDAKSVLRHELMHDRIEGADQGKLKEIWGSMDKDKKDEVNRKIRSEWTGGESFTDNQIMNEYFAEGAANFGRKDTAGGIQLESGQAKALQQAGVKMKAVPEEEEDIKVAKMSGWSMRRAVKIERKAEEAEARKNIKQKKRESKEAQRRERTKTRDEEPKLSKEQDLGKAKADAQNKVSEYRKRVTDRENKEKEFEDRSSNLNRSKKEAEQIRQQAVQAQKEGKTDKSQEMLKDYNFRVAGIKKEEKEIGKVSKDVDMAKSLEVMAKNQAQESSRHYTAKENVFKAESIDKKINELNKQKGVGEIDFEKEISSLRLKRQDLGVKAIATGSKLDVGNVDEQISYLQKRLKTEGSPTKFEIEVPKSKVPKVDFDKQISDLEINRKRAFRESLKTGDKSEVENIDKQISQLQTQKANQPKETEGGGFQKVDINKEIRDLNNTINSLKDGLKNPKKSDGEKDSIRKDLGANNIKLNVLKDQKNKAIEQQIQELNQKKAGLGQSQKNIEQSRFSPSRMGATTTPASKPFSTENFVKETSVAEGTPQDYRIDANTQQIVNNNITNVVNVASGGQGVKELTNAVVAGLGSPAGRFYMTKALQKGMSDMPDSVRSLLAPDFVNMVSDSEKAAQDKDLAGKMKNYIGDVKIAMEGLGNREN